MRRAVMTPVLGFAVACGTANMDRSATKGRTADDVTVKDVPVHGHVIFLDLTDGKKLDGELLAADAWGLWMLTEKHGTLGCPWRHIRRLRVWIADSRGGAAGAWTGLGTVSTLSHGFFLVLTVPMWLAMGIPATVAESKLDEQKVRRGDEPGLWQFARFPQGLPSGWKVDNEVLEGPASE